MFLKSLELNGFKSFPQKTVLEFPGGITGIVGPNGSGKSNIIDCIRWLLGERDSKNLRGSKVEDLIWNGTPKKPKVSIAQAGLNFDNNTGFFPIDFREIVVGRKVGRNGISQYFLNKSEVRLKDIVDFFSRSRLGTKGFTIIGQGSSDLFVRVTPEERKVMIEEILGLREYQLKKHEAERKLKNTFINLEKVKAMIEEVVPRLRLLKRQANKWSKRTVLEGELKQLEDKYFSFKLKEIKSAEEEIKPKLLDLIKEIGVKQRELGVLETEIKKIDSQPQEYEEIKKIKQEQSRFLAERSQIEKELGRLEGKLEFMASIKAGDKAFENEELVSLIQEIRKSLEVNLNLSTIEELKKSTEKLMKRISEFLSPHREKQAQSEEFLELEKIKINLAEKIKIIEKELEGQARRESEITSAMEEFNKQFQKNFEAVEKKRKELRDLEEKHNKLVFEKERLALKMEEIKNKFQEINRSLKDFGLIETGHLSVQDLAEAEKRMLRLRGELASIGEIDQTLIKEAQEVESHYSFLTNQSKDLETAAINLKDLIKELGEKINSEFNVSLRLINEEFNKFFRLMFGGGSAKMKIRKQEKRIKNGNGEVESQEGRLISEENDEEQEILTGIEIELNLPKKRITGLEMLSGGERSLVSIAALFALISVSPPPFLVLDEIDAALDESNSQRFANLVKEFSKKTQFIIATHNRATMEAADVLYGVTMGDDGASRILSLKLEN